MDVILMLAGGTISLVGLVMFLIEAFKASVWWGLGCLFCGPASLIFLILYWHAAKKPFFIQLVGFGLIMVAGAISG